MKIFDYTLIFILIIAIFLSLNVCVASDDLYYMDNNTLQENINDYTIVSHEDNSNEVSLSQSDDNYLSDDESEDVLSDNENFNNIYVSPDGSGSGAYGDPTSLMDVVNNIQDNTIVHMADGEYNIDSTLAFSSKNNITIVSDNPGNAIITGGSSSLNYIMTLSKVNNFVLKDLTIKNIIHNKGFIQEQSSGNAFKLLFPKNLTIDGCSFINCTGGNLLDINVADTFYLTNCSFFDNDVNNIIYLRTIEVYNESKNTVDDSYFIKASQCFVLNSTFKNNIITSYAINFYNSRGELTINECDFINNTFTKSDIYIQNINYLQSNAAKKVTFYAPVGVTKITDCNFTENNVNIPAVYIDSINSEGLIFEDNYVKSKYSIQFSTNSLKSSQTGINYNVGTKSIKNYYLGKIQSIVEINILNNDVVNVSVGEKIDISTTLVDNMGNAINIPNLRLIIDGSEYPTDFINGVYITSFTVPNKLGLVDIGVNYTTMDKSSGFSFADNQLHDNIEFSLLNNRMCEVFGAVLNVKPAVTFVWNDVNNTIYGENITFSINITNLESGNLTYSFIKEDKVIKTIAGSFSNNVSTVNVNDLPAGEYTIKVDYDDGEIYGPTTTTNTLTVNKANSTVQIIIDPTIPVGDNITVQAVLPANATGNITYRLKGENKTVNVTESSIFAGLSEGNYTIYAVYNGDGNYNPSEEYNATFKVVKVDPKLVIEYSTPVINENVTVTVTMDKDINGDVNVTINKLDPVVKQIINGTLTFNITNVPYGPQNITVSFKGNDKYNEMENNTSFFVNKLDVDLVISAETVSYGEPLVVNVTANEKFTGDVIVKINNFTETVHVVDGKGNVTFNNLTAAEYFITANFTGDDFFYADSANTTATVKGVEVPADKALNTNVPANSKSPTFSIKLDKDATGNFTVSVDNGKIVKTVALKDGSASITVDNLAVGSHQVTVSYSGDGKYAPIVQNTTLTIKEPAKTPAKVTPKATKIVAKKKTFKAKVKVKKYTITLKSGKTLLKKVKVTLKVKGKTYKATTNKKGKATFKIKNLKKKGTYKAVIKFKGNKNYKATSKKVKIKVKK